MTGQIYRLYPSDDQKHYTAVAIAGGKVLEVKGPDTTTKTTYDSLEQWKTARGPAVKFEESPPAFNVRKGDEFYGFHYPVKTSNKYQFGAAGVWEWPRWCFSMIREGAPQLLKEEAVRNAYNSLITVLKKYNGHTHREIHLTLERYAVSNLQWKDGAINYHGQAWCGAPFIFVKEPRLTYVKSIDELKTTAKNIEFYVGAREEILKQYKALYDLIAPTLIPYMKRAGAISYAKKELEYAEKVIREYPVEIANRTKYLEKANEKLSTLKQNLADAEAASYA